MIVFVRFAYNCLQTAHSYFQTGNSIHFFVNKILYTVQSLSLRITYSYSLQVHLVVWYPTCQIHHA